VRAARDNQLLLRATDRTPACAAEPPSRPHPTLSLSASRGERRNLALALAALALAILTLLTLSACAPKAAAPAAVTLDCALGFDALKARIAGQGGVVAAPADPGDPFRAYNAADGQASWFVTEPGAPAHPAVLMQQVTPAGLKNTGCAYGDRGAYDQLMAYLVSLKAGRK